MVSLLRNLGLALAAFVLIASCGNNAAPAGDAMDSGTSITRAADGDIDGMIVEYGQITAKIKELSDKAANGDVAAATEAANYGMRLAELSTALGSASLTEEQSMKLVEAANAAMGE